MEQMPDETIKISNENPADARGTREIFNELAQLKSRKNEILAFRDITIDDRRILQEIEEKMATLKVEAKNRLFRSIDAGGGAYSPTNDIEYSPEEIKSIIDKVLVGALGINNVPRSPILGTSENLRQKVQKLAEIEQL